MAGLVNQYQQGAFTSPVNGVVADATVVLSNDNATRGKYNSHDADATIHVQSSTLASRPAASVAQRLWITTDGLRAYLDSGSAWQELAYLPLASGGTVAGATTFSSGGVLAKGVGAGTLRSDAAIEIQAATNAGLSLFQMANPGTTANETFIAFGGYDSAGVIQKTSSVSSKFANTNTNTGFSVLRFNATYSNGSGSFVDNTAFRIYGNAGAEFFGSSDTTGPGANILNVNNGILKSTGPSGNWASILTGNAGANNSFGLRVNAGTGSSDQALNIFDATGATLFFRVRGDGAATLTNGLNLSAGTLFVAPSTASITGLNLGSGVAPTSPSNGDVWFDGTNVKIRVGGVTKTFTIT